MPRSLDPSSKLTLVLACDADKPADVQPRIFARTLTLNQQRRLIAAMASIETATAETKIDAALDAAEVCLTGWKNMNDPETGKAIPFTRENIGDVLSLEELTEVFGFVSAAAEATADDKKKSE